jgi:ADP-heptose:LPS heptosyltransferase
VGHPKKILIIRGGAIGDFIVTLPVFKALKLLFPTAEIGCLSSPGIGELARTTGLSDEVRCLEDGCWAMFFVEDGELDSAASEWLESFDCIISFLHDPGGVWRANVARVNDGRFLAGCHRPAEESAEPASVTLLRVLETLGIVDADPIPRIELAQSSALSNTIALHPGSGSKLKNWPEEKWAQFISILIEDGESLLLVGGEAETEKVKRLATMFPNANPRVVLNESLTTVARELAVCRLFVGHDSGITHLAAALGLPCIVLWAQTNERVWCPLGEGVHVLKDPSGLETFQPRRVIDFLKKVSPIH